MVNRRITDYLTGQKAGKGSYFPLQNEVERATDKASEPREVQVLLDPQSSEDCRLLCFDTSSGKPIPRYKKEQDDWLHRRAKDSIDYFHLDEGTWNVKRKDLMDEVLQTCEEVERLLTDTPFDQQKYDAAIASLIAYLDPFEEFTAAALAVIRERGFLEQIAPSPQL
jgi:hypothetical protein